MVSAPNSLYGTICSFLEQALPIDNGNAVTRVQLLRIFPYTLDIFPDASVSTIAPTIFLIDDLESGFAHLTSEPDSD
ncbi:hypothetical protein D3C74_472270 [compost metagenome]